ncbi:MAG: esterase-like activity of phytase family protein [Pontibacterium sp.]
MLAKPLNALAAAIVIASMSTPALANNFNRIASFPTASNLPSDIPDAETSAEIIAATADGMMLAYSDSPLGGIGFLSLKDPSSPKAEGFVKLSGEPTAVTILGNSVFTGVNTSSSYTAPSGFLAMIDINTKTVAATCDLGGQPDSVAAAKDGSFVAVAIENERDEDLNDGEIPQLPAGYLSIVPLKNGKMDCAAIKQVNLTDLADVGAEDPEPEFVDINSKGEVVVTLQENNHIAIVNGHTGELVNHFPAGAVTLHNADGKKDGAFKFNTTLENVAREPDAAKWLDDNRFVIANEGDYKGGSRGFTIFHKDGTELYESGLDFEYRIAAAGHFPDKRAGKKGGEPEGLEVGVFNGETYIFVMSERGSAIGVYRDTGKAPEFVQLLPSGIAPESAVALGNRNLMVSANEKDLREDGGIGSHVMVFEYQNAAATYPHIEAVRDESGLPIGWGALSGLVADESIAGQLYAVSDSFYKSQPTIFKVDATQTPAKITDAIRVTQGGKAAESLDLEGITTDGKGGFWLASEGRTDKDIPHALYRTNAKGEIVETVSFPQALLDNEIRFGSEGVSRVGDTLWIAIQRSWKDDPENTVKLVSYNTQTKAWGAVRYPTEAATQGWVGLSEITIKGDKAYIVERDNQIGDAAKIKRLYSVNLAEMKAAPLGSELPLVKKTLVHDFIPDLKATNGFVVDKVEGFAIDAKGNTFVVTDNDGVDDSSGETLFFSIGKL